jgi:hypothetical protein
MPRPQNAKPRQRQRATRRNSKEAPVGREVDTSSVTVEISSLSTFNQSANVLLYGPIGNGKTALAGGLGKIGTFLGSDRGVVSAKETGSECGIILAPDWPHFAAGVELADRELGPEDWLIVDTHTRAQRQYIVWYLGAIHDENEARDLDIPALQDHQKWQNAFLRWTDHLISAPYNVLFICNEMTRTNASGEEVVMPLIRGGRNLEVCEEICAQVDVIMYYRLMPKQGKAARVRRAFFQPFQDSEEKRYYAKDHFNVFGEYQDVGENEYSAMSEFAAMING